MDNQFDEIIRFKLEIDDQGVPQQAADAQDRINRKLSDSSSRRRAPVEEEEAEYSPTRRRKPRRRIEEEEDRPRRIRRSPIASQTTPGRQPGLRSLTYAERNQSFQIGDLIALGIGRKLAAILSPMLGRAVVPTITRDIGYGIVNRLKIPNVTQPGGVAGAVARRTATMGGTAGIVAATVADAPAKQAINTLRELRASGEGIAATRKLTETVDKTKKPRTFLDRILGTNKPETPVVETASPSTSKAKTARPNVPDDVVLREVTSLPFRSRVRDAASSKFNWETYSQNPPPADQPSFRNLETGEKEPLLRQGFKFVENLVKHGQKSYAGFVPEESPIQGPRPKLPERTPDYVPGRMADQPVAKMIGAAYDPSKFKVKEAHAGKTTPEGPSFKDLAGEHPEPDEEEHAKAQAEADAEKADKESTDKKTAFLNRIFKGRFGKFIGNKLGMETDDGGAMSMNVGKLASVLAIGGSVAYGAVKTYGGVKQIAGAIPSGDASAGLHGLTNVGQGLIGGTAGVIGTMVGGPIVGAIAGIVVSKLIGVVHSVIDGLDGLAASFAKYNPAIGLAMAKYEMMHELHMIKMGAIFAPLVVSWMNLKEKFLDFLGKLAPMLTRFLDLIQGLIEGLTSLLEFLHLIDKKTDPSAMGLNMGFIAGMKQAARGTKFVSGAAIPNPNVGLNNMPNYRPWWWPGYNAGNYATPNAPASTVAPGSSLVPIPTGVAPGAGPAKGLGGMNIPAHARGAIVSRPEISLIGEAGPEAVIPMPGGAVPVNLNGRGFGRAVRALSNAASLMKQYAKVPSHGSMPSYFDLSPADRKKYRDYYGSVPTHSNIDLQTMMPMSVHDQYHAQEDAHFAARAAALKLGSASIPGIDPSTGLAMQGVTGTSMLTQPAGRRVAASRGIAASRAASMAQDQDKAAFAAKWAAAPQANLLRLASVVQQQVTLTISDKSQVEESIHQIRDHILSAVMFHADQTRWQGSMLDGKALAGLL